MTTLTDQATTKWEAARTEFARLQNEYPIGGRLVTIEVNARLRRTLGQYDPNSRTIEIARWLLEQGGESDVINTLRHEYAHALTPPQEPSHGKVWKTWAKRLGVRPSTAHNPPKWIAECPTHGRLNAGWHRRPRRTKVHRDCGEIVRLVQRKDTP